MKRVSLIVVTLLAGGLSLTACSTAEKAMDKVKSTVAGDSKPVGISGNMSEVTVKHNGKDTVISRNPDNGAVVNPDFAKTSRPCPPFCIQPIVLAPGVETIAELEMLDYLKQMSAGDDSILVVDSRTPDWVEKGTIPGAKNLPWTLLNPQKGATTESIIKLMSDEFSVSTAAGVDSFAVDEAIVAGTPDQVFDYSNAKTLVLFCNGMWCGQSPNNIMNLLKFGYPAEKIKWYRGGMQSWEVLGLSTAKP
ncbi:MAG: rhodanese-like domain-containing protein [Gammaproteobacteria bacterium]|nr:rhodanese-like domain-containing protein [Gammaproteobacteria bacterium]